MSLFLDRSSRAGRYLEWKVAIFVVGGTLAMGGIYLDERWLTGVALVVLVAGMFLRFLPRRSDGSEADAGSPDEDTPDIPY